MAIIIDKNMKKKPQGRPFLLVWEKSVNKTLAFPPGKLKQMQNDAISCGFTTAKGNPKLAAYLMYLAGV